MAICRYYQQGQCRFGKDCQFEHPGAQTVFGGQRQGGQDITNTLVQTVKVDMEQWERGKQWSFSCYSPAKETGCFPGIEDWSPEEMRFEAYTAKATNNTAQYEKKVQDMALEYQNKRRALVNPTEPMKEILRKIYNKENVQGFGNVFSNVQANPVGGGGGIFGQPQSSSSIFGSGSAASIFGGPSSSNSIFGKPAASSGGSIFGSAPAQTGLNNSSQPFGTTASSSSIFGSAPSTQNSISGGAAHQSNSFIKPATSSSLFGQPPATTAASSSTIFGQPQQTFGTPQPSFGQAGASVFGQAPAPSLFGGQGQAPNQSQPQPPITNTSSIFGSPVQSSPFATPPPNQGVFGTPPSAPVISMASTTTTSFPAAPAPAAGGSIFASTSDAPLSNPFGQSAQTSAAASEQGLFGQKIKNLPDPSKYSRLEDLTDEDKLAFSSPEFAIGKIPIRPPLKEMCS